MADKPSFPEPQSQQPNFVFTQAYDPSEGQDSQINLMDYIRVLWNRRYLILMGSILVALTFLVLSLREVDIYKAHATLILQPPQFSTDLKPPPLSAGTLKAMLETDFITSQLLSQLIKDDVLEADTPVEGIRGMLEILIYPGREQNQTYMPLIDLVVRSDSPENPAVIANACAEVFISETAKLTRRSQEGTLDFIGTQFPLVRNTLMSLESELQEKHTKSDLELMKAEKNWNLRILDLRRRLNPELLKRELSIGESQMAEFERELLGVGLAIQTQKDTLTYTKKEIQSQPKYLVLSKAVTDEALWNQIGGANGGLPDALTEQQLSSEFLNPIYQELLSLLTTTQINYEILAPKREYLINAIERSREMINERNSLIAQAEYELEILKSGFETEVTRLARERDLVVDQLTREIDSVQITYQAMAEKFETAKLAKADEEPYLRIGAWAVKPTRPMTKHTSSNVLAGLGVGFILSAILAFVLEYVQLNWLTISAERKLESSPSRSLGS
jgi:capsular polysaccharide biosynthesis protein